MKKFKSPAIAASELGISVSYLRKLARSCKQWEANVHYQDRRSPISAKPSYYYCVEEISKWFSIATEKRA